MSSAGTAARPRYPRLNPGSGAERKRVKREFEAVPRAEDAHPLNDATAALEASFRRTRRIERIAKRRLDSADLT